MSATPRPPGDTAAHDAVAPPRAAARRRRPIAVLLLPAARLPAALQELLGRLEHAVAATRGTAVDEGDALGAGEVVQIFDVLLERGSRDPRGHALDSALELAARKPELVGRLAEALDALPAGSVPMQLPAKLVAAIDPRPAELTAVLERWRTAGPRALKRAAAEALGG